jgi:hypothetical protein
MPATAITTSQMAPFKCPKNTGIGSLTPIALDETNGNTIPYDSNMTLVFQETGGTNPNTVTITSATDSNGRSKSQAITVPADGVAVVPPLDALYNVDGVINIAISGTGTLVLIPPAFTP